MARLPLARLARPLLGVALGLALAMCVVWRGPTGGLRPVLFQQSSSQRARQTVPPIQKSYTTSSQRLLQHSASTLRSSVSSPRSPSSSQPPPRSSTSSQFARSSSSSDQDSPSSQKFWPSPAPEQRSPQLVRLSDTAPRRAGLAPGKPRTILYWNKFWNNADFYVGFGDQPFRGCAFRNCETTNNRSRLADADAVVFHMLNGIQPLPSPRLPHHRFIFFLKEPPLLNLIATAPYRGVFNLTMTYRLDSDVVNNYWKVQPGPEPLPLPPPGNRSRPVAWIVSHCETPSGRELYVDLLQEHLPVDVYGACGTHSCPTGAHDHREACYEMVAARYFFYLAFENSQCRDYITEKLALPLQYGLVPVVLGPSRADYERTAPPDSFIHVDDFAGPRELADHLRYLMANGTAYRQYFRWRERFQVGGSRAWCDLCRYLHEERPAQYYVDIGQWWYAESGCRLQPVVQEPEEDETGTTVAAESDGRPRTKQRRHPGPAHR